MRKNRLILFEGIPGSGKTTTSQWLHQYLLSIGIEASVFVEGSDHPIDLPFHAFLSKKEFDDLTITYPIEEEWLNKHSIIESEYVLVPYKKIEQKPDHVDLINFLESKEFCYSSTPVVSFQQFKQVFKKRFERFIESTLNTSSVTILESVLFQHQIHDINRLYPHIQNSEIIAYIVELAAMLISLDPILFYLSQANVGDALIHTAKIRSKPKWGTPESIEYYKARKALELDIIKQLTIEAVIINNTSRDWKKTNNEIIEHLNLSGIPQ